MARYNFDKLNIPTSVCSHNPSFSHVIKHETNVYKYSVLMTTLILHVTDLEFFSVVANLIKMMWCITVET